MGAAEFDAMGLADLDDLSTAWRDRVVREDIRAGYLCSLVDNAMKGNTDIAAHPADFFPSLEHLRPQLTPEQMEAKLDEVFGQINRNNAAQGV